MDAGTNSKEAWPTGAASPPALVGGRFRLEAPLPASGRLPLLRAQDLTTGFPVAVTCIDARRFAELGPIDVSGPLLARTLARAAELEHPRIGRQIAFCVLEDRGFVVTGVPYQVGLEPLAGCSTLDAIRFGIYLLDGLQYAHRHGVTHGCLDTDSVWLTRAGQVKINQFGMYPVLAPVPGVGPVPDPVVDINAAAQLLLQVLAASAEPLDSLALSARSVAIGALEKRAFRTASALRQVLVTTLQANQHRAARPRPLPLVRPASLPVRGTASVPANAAWVPGGLLRSPHLGDVLHQPFLLDRHLVTNADFERFVATTGEPPPRHWRSKSAPPTRRDHPVVNVTADAAARYARWCGRRLPTAVEWEAAAASVCPWGSVCDVARLNSPASGFGETTPVGAFPAGASADGVHDLLGNVWEWVDSGEGVPALEAGYAWVYGGSFRHEVQVAGSIARAPVARTHTHDHVGFRCALSWDGVP